MQKRKAGTKVSAFSFLEFFGEGAWEDLAFAFVAVEVGVENDGRAVGVLEGLVGLEGFAQGFR